MATVTEMEINPDLEPEVQTDKQETKMLPCRECGRGCVVNRFKDPRRTVCSKCRGSTDKAEPVYEFNEELETEVLTDKKDTKELPCSRCGRRCVVTTFKSAASTVCNTCKGVKKAERRQEVQIKAARTVNPATLENLNDALINPAFREPPLCPFDPEHSMTLRSVSHSANAGPRQFRAIVRGVPVYDQETGESVIYQCVDCNCVVSFSTQHPMQLLPQNAPAEVRRQGIGALESILGIEVEEAA